MFSSRARSEAGAVTVPGDHGTGAVARRRGRPPKSIDLTLDGLRELLAKVFGDTATIVAVEMVWANTAVVIVRLMPRQPGGRTVYFRVPQVTVSTRRTPIRMAAGDNALDHWDPLDYIEPGIVDLPHQNREAMINEATGQLREGLIDAVLDQVGSLRRKLN